MSIDFRQNKTDQYLFVKNNKKSVILLIYVDNATIIGMRENINEMIEKIKTVFKIKIERGLNNFLGCSILREEDSNEY